MHKLEQLSKQLEHLASPAVLIVRLVASGVVIGVLLVVCSHVPHVDHATVALMMVLAIVGLAWMWGSMEAMTGALLGGLGFDYYFLPPRGFTLTAPEHWVALATFLITAVVTGQLAARLKRRRIEAEQGQTDLRKLHQLADALLQGGSVESTAARLADQIVEIFGASGVVVYIKRTGQIVRSGPGAAAISDQALHEAATSTLWLADARPGFSLTPIRHGGGLVGSIGISGVKLTESLFQEIAARVGLGLARLYAIEKITDAEVVRRSEELKSAVLDAMAHEIRNPLNSIKLGVTTLRSGGLASESLQQEMLSIIEEEANRMDRFIDETLQLACLEARELSLSKQAHNIARLIPAVVEEMKTVATGRDIQICVPESLPLADCDQGMMVRVLKQLLGNALKYSPEDSPLTVSAEFTGAAIVIDVVDCGPGIAEEERERIFEKYYRGRSARSGTPGTGLGLASAKCIVEAHGGNIWVTAAPGGGAAFHVSLPLAAANHMAGVT